MATTTTPPSSASGTLAAAKAAAGAMPQQAHAAVTVRIEPPRGLFEYQYKVEGGKLLIEAGQLPTLSTTASLGARKSGCQG